MLRMYLLALGGLTLTAQTQIDLRTQAKHIDFTTADSTRPLKTGTALPATCVPGDMFFKTDAPAGANLYGCTAANTWSVQGGLSSANCLYDADSGTLRCTDAQGNVYDAPQGAIASVFGRTGSVTALGGDYTTAQVTESGNLYFTNGRARAALAGGGPLTFNSSSGVMDCPGCVTTATTADTDLYGSFPHLSVVRLQGRPVASTSPANLQYLGWNSSANQWEAKPLPDAPVTSMFGRTGTITAQNGDYAFSQIAGTVSAPQLPGVAMRTDQGNAVTAGTQDFRNAAHTLPMKSGTVATLPSACTAGETYFATDAPAGGNVYGCTATNIWSAQGNLTVKSGGFTVGTRGAANFVTGAGLMSTISDDGAEINIQSALDSAVIETLPGEQSGSALLCASGSGSASQYRCALNPTLAAYTSGMVLHWKPDVAGAGGPTTLNVDTLGTKPLKMADGVSDPSSSDISAGKLYNVWYDGGSFRLMATTGTTGGGAVASVFGRTGPVSAQSGDYSTAQVAESGNLYFTNARVWSALGANGPIAFNGATGTIACPTCLTTETVLAAAQEPAHTGDMTNAAGSLATTVGKINGGAIPTDGKPVKTNGSGQLVDAVAGTDYQAPLAAATNAVAGTVTMSTATSSVAVATDDSRNTNSRAPTGSASGDLSGSYPSPTVAKVNGTSVPTNSSADQVLVTTSSAVAAWTTLSGCAANGQVCTYNTTTHLWGVKTLAAADMPSTVVFGAASLDTAGYVPYVTSAGTLGLDKTVNHQLSWNATSHALQVGTTSTAYDINAAFVGNFPGGYQGAYTWYQGNLISMNVNTHAVIYITDGQSMFLGKVGINAGTAFITGAPSAQLTTVGSGVFYDPTTLGAELAPSDSSCTGWTLNTGWTCSSGVITHTAGTGTAHYTPAITAGNTYRLVFTTTRTAGSVTPSVGGTAGAAVATAVTSTFDIATTTTGDLIFTPTTDFAGTINVGSTLSLKPPLAASVSVARNKLKPISYADVASVPSPSQGDVIFCGNCKNTITDGVAAGSTYASGGHGAFLGYQESTWIVMIGGGGGGTTRTYPYVWQGAVQSGVTGFAVNLPAASAPTPTNSGGTMPMAALEWPTGQSTYYAWWTWVLPAGYTTNAAISYSIESRCNPGTCDSTHTNIMTLGLGCASGAALDAPTIANASPVNITNSAAAIRTVTAGTLTPNSGGLPACAAGNRVWVKMLLDTNTNSLTGPFDLMSATFSVQGSM